MEPWYRYQRWRHARPLYAVLGITGFRGRSGLRVLLDGLAVMSTVGTATGCPVDLLGLQWVGVRSWARMSEEKMAVVL